MIHLSCKKKVTARHKCYFTKIRPFTGTGRVSRVFIREPAKGPVVTLLEVRIFTAQVGDKYKQLHIFGYLQKGGNKKAFVGKKR